MYSYITIYTCFKKYAELLNKLPTTCFVNILFTNKNKNIDPEKTFMIMYSKESEPDAFYICSILVKEGFAYVIRSDRISSSDDRIYMRVI